MKKSLKIFGILSAVAVMFAVSLTSCSKGGNESVDNTVITNIKLRKDTLYLLKNGSYKLRYDIEPDTADEPNVKWESSDKNVATVDKNGKVTAKNKVGKSTITVSTVDGKLSDKCEVIVSADINSVTLKPTSISLTKGKSFQLTATINPSDATQGVEWSSDNTKVATVDKDGNVTAINEGTAIITAKSVINSEKKATCKVEVTPVGVKLNFTELVMARNETVRLIATIEPSEMDQSIDWSSSASGVVSVDANGNVKAISEGKATITATSKADKSKTATCEIEVLSKIIYCIGNKEGGSEYFLYKNGIDVTNVFVPDKDENLALIKVAVSQTGDVYVVGRTTNTTVVWKNGKKTITLPLLATALSVTKNGDIYYCWRHPSLGLQVGKNTTSNYSSISLGIYTDAEIYSVFVDKNENIYAVGNAEKAKESRVATLWKNGKIYYRDESLLKYYRFLSGCVINNDIYTVAESTYGSSVKVCKNESILYVLEIDKNSAKSTDIRNPALYITEKGDIYVSAKEYYGNSFIWKNGSQISNIINTTGSTLFNSDFPFLYVSKDDKVYVTGESELGTKIYENGKEIDSYRKLYQVFIYE